MIFYSLGMKMATLSYVQNMWNFISTLLYIQTFTWHDA